MCKCTPNIRTPFCGAPGCDWPPQKDVERAACKHFNFAADVGVARLEDSGGFIAEIRIHCADCGQAFQFVGLGPGIDTQGARVSIDGLEANICIVPAGTRPNPLQRMAFNVSKFDG